PMLRAILEEIPTPPERVTLLVATGTHRPATPAELEAMFGSELLSACEVVNHRCQDAAELVRLPDTANGVPVLLNRRFLEANVRITTGFVEPHFFAGFSGGPKMVAPGLAGMETILVLHDEARIGHPSAVFGITEGNPVHDDVRAIARQVGVDFGLDVLLDGDKRITGVFGGDLLEEHARACLRSHEEAMCPVDRPFEVVVATNSGYPLDQNLYQAVKGMSAAERIVGTGGTIFCAAECRDGIPDEGAYARALRAGGTLAEVRATLAAARVRRPDDWQIQVHCRILERASVGLYSSLAEETVRAAHLEPVQDLSLACREALGSAGEAARLAVLPHGPVTIPYLR
ncbi:MAG: nickel-dependent lactate racemase, partial [Acidobacteria bacterium]|nr:nickel-dependent lactate racemase [Acidobacteriota bacterium]